MRVTGRFLLLTVFTLGISTPAQATHDPSLAYAPPPGHPLQVAAGLLQRQVCKLAPLAFESQSTSRRLLRFRGGTQLLVVLQTPTKTVAIDRAGQLFVADRGTALRPVPARVLVPHRIELLRKLRALSGQAVDLETTRDRIRLVTL